MHCIWVWQGKTYRPPITKTNTERLVLILSLEVERIDGFVRLCEGVNSTIRYVVKTITGMFGKYENSAKTILGTYNDHMVKLTLKHYRYSSEPIIVSM